VKLVDNQEQTEKVQLILNELFPNENVDVPDPYFGLPNGFNTVYKMLDEACEVIAKKLIAKHT
jgi:protein-tyrosine phosphatase